SSAGCSTSSPNGRSCCGGGRASFLERQPYDRTVGDVGEWGAQPTIEDLESERERLRRLERRLAGEWERVRRESSGEIEQLKEELRAAARRAAERERQLEALVGKLRRKVERQERLLLLRARLGKRRGKADGEAAIESEAREQELAERLA